jgi:hypothetical protein
MKNLIAALIATVFATAAFAQTPAADVKTDAKATTEVKAAPKAKAKHKAKAKKAAPAEAAAAPAMPAK